MKSSATFIIVVLLSSLLNLITVEAEVITLTADTFSDKVVPLITNPYLFWGRSDALVTFFQAGDYKVKEKDTAWFVKFCVPWCKHCKSLGTLWEDVGKAMEADDQVEIGEVDCGAERSVCTKVDIHSYPTFKLFYDGEEVARYKGPRNVDTLKAFVFKEAEKAAAKAHDIDRDL